jgi:hypothetical protein
MVMLTACREKEKGSVLILLCRCWWCSVVCDAQTYPFYLFGARLYLFYKRNLTPETPPVNRGGFGRQICCCKIKWPINPGYGLSSGFLWILQPFLQEFYIEWNGSD